MTNNVITIINYYYLEETCLKSPPYFYIYMSIYIQSANKHNEHISILTQTMHRKESYGLIFV